MINQTHDDHRSTLQQALRYKLAILNPGRPPRPLAHYLSRPESVVWMPLSQRDIAPARFWQRFCRTVSTWSTWLATQLEAMDLPETHAGRDHLVSLFAQAHRQCGEPVLFFNHSGFFSSSQIQRLVDRLIEVARPNCPFILLIEDGHPVPVPEEEAQTVMTFQDIVCPPQTLGLLMQTWLNAALSEQQIAAIQRETGGWAPALYLLGMQLLQHQPGQEPDLSRAVAGVHGILDREFFQPLDPVLRLALVQLSLVNDYHPNLMESTLLLPRQTLEEEILRTPFFQQTGDGYVVQPMLLSFLKTKQKHLPAPRRQRFFVRAGEWYEVRGIPVRPLDCYLEAGDYRSAVRHLSHLNFLAVPPDLCRRYDALIDRIPPRCSEDHPMLLVYRILLCYRLQTDSKAIPLMNRLVETATPARHAEGAQALGEYHLLKALFHWGRGQEFAWDMARARQRLPHGSAIFTGSSCGLVGAASCFSLDGVLSMDQQLEQFRQAAPHMACAMGGYGAGTELLAQCEMHFYRGQLDAALAWADNAVEAAEASRQWDIAANACYLRMRTQVARGSWSGLKASYTACVAYSHRDRDGDPARLTMGDMAKVFLYCMTGRQTRLDDGSQVMAGYLSALRKLTPQQQLIIQSLMGEYKPYEMLESIHTALSHLPQRLQWPARLYLLIFRALLHLPDHAQRAMEELQGCYRMTCRDSIITPYGEYGGGMIPLIRAARARPALHSIPGDWLDRVEESASLFDDGLKRIRLEFFQSGAPFFPQIPMTRREREAFALLCSGKSTQEIAQEMDATVNTVKVTLSHIYKKLGVKNRKEAVGLAMTGNRFE